MPKISKLTEVQAKEEFAKVTNKGAWKDLIEKVKKEKTSMKVEDLTRGQVAALYRTAINAGLKVRTSYKEKYIVLSPA